MNAIKNKLYALCADYVGQRINTAQQAIEMAQASADEETKSSVGDKYETARAMMQLEMEKHHTMLNDALKTKQVLEKINLQQNAQSIQPGSLVWTNYGNFFVSISAGQLRVENETYFAISPATPIGSKLIGLKPGATFQFNNKSYHIEKIV